MEENLFSVENEVKDAVICFCENIYKKNEVGALSFSFIPDEICENSYKKNEDWCLVSLFYSWLEGRIWETINEEGGGDCN